MHAKLPSMQSSACLGHLFCVTAFAKFCFLTFSDLRQFTSWILSYKCFVCGSTIKLRVSQNNQISLEYAQSILSDRLVYDL